MPTIWSDFHLAANVAPPAGGAGAGMLGLIFADMEMMIEVEGQGSAAALLDLSVSGIDLGAELDPSGLLSGVLRGPCAVSACPRPVQTGAAGTHAFATPATH